MSLLDDLGDDELATRLAARGIDDRTVALLVDGREDEDVRRTLEQVLG